MWSYVISRQGPEPAAPAPPSTDPVPRPGGSPRRRRRRPVGRVLVTGVGVVLIWSALCLAGYAVGWQLHKDHAQGVLVRSERSAIAKQHNIAAARMTLSVTRRASGNPADR